MRPELRQNEVDGIKLSYERSAHLGSTQKMKMNVIDGLAGMIPAIEYRSEPRSRQFQLRGDKLYGLEEILEDVHVLRLYIQNIYDVLFGNNEHMNRRLGGDIAEGKDPVVLEDLFAR